MTNQEVKTKGTISSVAEFPDLLQEVEGSKLRAFTHACADSALSQNCWCSRGFDAFITKLPP